MGGEGFMQQANNSIKHNRAQIVSTRSKFKDKSNESYSEGLNTNKKLDFSHLTEAQIESTRKKIEEDRIQKRKKEIIVFSVAILISISVIYFLVGSFLWS